MSNFFNPLPRTLIIFVDFWVGYLKLLPPPNPELDLLTENLDILCGLLIWQPQINPLPLHELDLLMENLGIWGRLLIWLLATSDSFSRIWPSHREFKTFCADFRFGYLKLRRPPPPNWTFSWKILHGLQLVNGMLPSRCWVYVAHTRLWRPYIWSFGMD